MVIIISYVIAIVLTIVLAIVLYPISAIFYIVGFFGKLVGSLGDFIFKHANRGIKKLWSDIRHTKVVRDNSVDNRDSNIENVIKDAEDAIGKAMKD